MNARVIAQQCAAILLLCVLEAPSLGTAANPDVGGVKQFLADIYSHYEAGREPLNPFGPDADRLFEPGLLDLIRRDRKQADGEVGLLDHDPLCSCQDYDSLTSIVIDVRAHHARSARAIVSFNNGELRVRVKFRLIFQHGNWRIFDIEETDMPSLRRSLQNQGGASENGNKAR